MLVDKMVDDKSKTVEVEKVEEGFFVMATNTLWLE